MPREPLRVVCYAVNGTGVGHLVRLLSIARWLRRYAAALDTRLEVWFLTTSEADSLAFAEGFAAFKIPSKTIVREAGLDRTAYLALAKQWIWHTLGLLRPDLFIVDTFPRGSFGELLGALDLCRRRAFVHRPVRAEVASRPDFQAMLPLYDLVLVPEREGPLAVPLPAAVHDRVVHTGPVLSRERWEMWPRAEARARLGIGPDQKCVFVSAGGGGDDQAGAQIARAVQSLAGAPGISLVVGTGPLYRGSPLPGVTLLPGRAADWSLAFDAAVSAAGYNSFGELMFAGVPTAFLPQEKLADDQGARARAAVDRGAALLLERGADILAAVRELVTRDGAADAARSLVPENGARVAAAELLRLIVPPARVDLAESALDDERLAALPRARELEGLTLACQLSRGREQELGSAIDRAAALLAPRPADEPKELRLLALAIAQGLSSRPVAARAAVCQQLLADLGPLAPGDGAAAHAAVAGGRWGETAEPGTTAPTDALALARLVRGAQGSVDPGTSSSLRSWK